LKIRFAVVDTILSLSGGVDGKSPMPVKAGTQVNYWIWMMHRGRDLFGEDAEEFNPERWGSLRQRYQ